MIYASDLDRTLIFSQAFLDMHPTPSDSELIIADKSKVNSFIDSRVYQGLKCFVKSNKVKFIPVTTRSILEYQRTIISQKLSPEWAITTCGGQILHFGEVFKPWEEYLHQYLDFEQLNEIINEFNRLEATSAYKSKLIDNRYIFSKTTDRDKTKADFLELEKKYKDYRFTLDKHKVYAIPRVFDKGKTLTWLSQWLDNDLIVSSGDSGLDVPMMLVSDIFFLPNHHNIKDFNAVVEGYTGKVIDVQGGAISPLGTIEKVLSMVSL